METIKNFFIISIIIILLNISFLYAESINVAPLINLDELQPSYDEEILDTKNLDEFNKDSFIKSKNTNFDESFVTISLLNKITAEVKTVNIKLKQDYIYEELKIYAIDCYNSKPLEKKETAAYLNIYNKLSMEKIFNGWMIKSLPSVSSMEHPIYDIWVDNCNKL